MGLGPRGHVPTWTVGLDVGFGGLGSRGVRQPGLRTVGLDGIVALVAGATALPQPVGLLALPVDGVREDADVSQPHLLRLVVELPARSFWNRRLRPEIL